MDAEIHIGRTCYEILLLHYCGVTVICLMFLVIRLTIESHDKSQRGLFVRARVPQQEAHQITTLSARALWYEESVKGKKASILVCLELEEVTRSLRLINGVVSQELRGAEDSWGRIGPCGTEVQEHSCQCVHGRFQAEPGLLSVRAERCLRNNNK